MSKIISLLCKLKESPLLALRPTSSPAPAAAHIAWVSPRCPTGFTPWYWPLLLFSRGLHTCSSLPAFLILNNSSLNVKLVSLFPYPGFSPCQVAQFQKKSSKRNFTPYLPLVQSLGVMVVFSYLPKPNYSCILPNYFSTFWTVREGKSWSRTTVISL